VHDGVKYKPNRTRGPKYSSCAQIPINIAKTESGTNKISALPQHNLEKRLLALSCLSVLLPVRIENQSFQSTDFLILCDGVFDKTSTKLLFLNLTKNRYLVGRPT
jgi:hypothetical protein